MARPLVGPALFDSMSERDAEASCKTNLVAAPSPLSNVTARSFIDARPFRKMGAWGETVTVARHGMLLRAIRWLAMNRSNDVSYPELWSQCQRANPRWFTSFRTVRMLEPSFFLPAGEVVFQVIENPSQIPDRPPQGVMLRHWEAMMAAPDATFYFLRPVFVADPEPRLYTASDLREEAEADRDDAVFAARLYGSTIRAAAWTQRRIRDVARWGLRGATLGMRGMAWLLGARRRAESRRLAAEFHARVGRRGLDDFLARTMRSDLEREVADFRRALVDLRTRLPIDPILCFEIPHRPGELWFEAHWFEGRDGKTYVSY